MSGGYNGQAQGYGSPQGGNGQQQRYPSAYGGGQPSQGYGQQPGQFTIGGPSAPGYSLTGQQPQGGQPQPGQAAPWGMPAPNETAGGWRQYAQNNPAPGYRPDINSLARNDVNNPAQPPTFGINPPGQEHGGLTGNPGMRVGGPQWGNLPTFGIMPPGPEHGGLTGAPPQFGIMPPGPDHGGLNGQNGAYLNPNSFDPRLDPRRWGY